MNREKIIKDFTSAVGAFIRRHRILRRGDGSAPVVVALSGGADSVALLAVLLDLGFDCRAAHCNFHLRGEESMRDMRHCEEICARLNTDLYIKDFNVGERMAATGESLEMACRELRYRWFADLLDRDYSQAVAVGHHREDQAETLMLNLLRGSGIAGLAGMKPRNGNVARPLLEMSRREIEEYLAARDLPFITDSSNASDAHRRNRLRNRVFPLLEELFPRATDGILRTCSNLASARDFYDDAIAASSSPYRHDDGSIELGALAANERHAPLLLFEMLRPEGFNATQTSDMLKAAMTGSTGVHFRAADGSGTVAELDRGILHILQSPESGIFSRDAVEINLDRDVLSPVHIAVSRHRVEEFRPSGSNAGEVFIDSVALEGAPRWQLRHYRRGDRMKPFGLNGSKLVSDLFSNAKYSAARKREAWLLTRNDEILWIPGLRTSALFTIGPETKSYLRLRLLTSNS